MNNEPIVFLDTEYTGLCLQKGNRESLLLLVLNFFLGILQGQLFKQPLRGQENIEQRSSLCLLSRS
ncbi:MAG: hypothetical protein ACI9IJ_001371 [Psychromonas sp.]|jgi:hypothetical protein